MPRKTSPPTFAFSRQRSDSLTLDLTQRTSKAGKTPTRNAYRQFAPTARPASVAIQVPSTLVAWKIPEACARAFEGKTSATRLAATAHSPPTPIATRKRSAATCPNDCAKKVSPEKIEYIKIVTTIV